jgi:hypothetical protein
VLFYEKSGLAATKFSADEKINSFFHRLLCLEFSRHCFITTERPTTPLFRVTGIVIKPITLP